MALSEGGHWGFGISLSFAYLLALYILWNVLKFRLDKIDNHVMKWTLNVFSTSAATSTSKSISKKNEEISSSPSSSCGARILSSSSCLKAWMIFFYTSIWISLFLPFGLSFAWGLSSTSGNNEHKKNSGLSLITLLPGLTLLVMVRARRSSGRRKNMAKKYGEIYVFVMFQGYPRLASSRPRLS